MQPGVFVPLSFLDRNSSANSQEETQRMCQELKLISVGCSSRSEETPLESQRGSEVRGESGGGSGASPGLVPRTTPPGFA